MYIFLRYGKTKNSDTWRTTFWAILSESGQDAWVSSMTHIFEEKESKYILIRYLCFDKNNPNFVSFCCYSSYYYYLTPHFNFFCRTLSENCYYIQRITYYFNFFWLNLRICKKYKRFNSDRVI